MMKKICFIVTVFVLASTWVKAQKLCCPVFEFGVGLMIPCEERMQPESTYVATQKECDYNACKHTASDYYVFPKKIGYTYNWQVIGGSPATASGNQVQVTWGNGTTGKITIFIKSPDGTCRDTLTETFCLQDAPTANFNFNPASPVCLNQLVQFNNTSTGAKLYYWDFGDGSSSTLVNPSHNYTTPGTYTITLAVSNGVAPPIVPDSLGNEQIPAMECGCRDTIRKTITVKNESGITIIPGCKQMLCKGDTASYCTTNNCNAYNWSVMGGRILGSANGKCINVVWDGSYPATVTLSGNCGGACGNSGTLQVPVLYPSMPIQGNNMVCPNSFYSYSLPSMPGTFYKWKITGPWNKIIGADSNTNVINVQWGKDTGSYTITCHYNNPHTGCSGDASIMVKILPAYKISGPTDFCVGQPFSYTANGPGTWTIRPTPGFTPANFPNGNTINGVWNKPGTYTVTATVLPSAQSNFCSYSDSKMVIVLDTPKLNAIVGPKMICPGSIQTYTVSSNMSDGFFSWNITGSTSVSYTGSQQQTAVITWGLAAPFEVKVKQTVNGCSSSYKTLAIDSFPSLTLTGEVKPCMDQAYTYTVSGTLPPGGTWSLSNNFGSIISQTANTVTVQWHGSSLPNPSSYVIFTGCNPVKLKVDIVIVKPVKITRAGILCAAAGITLTCSETGINYQWRLDGSLITPQVNAQSITVKTPGVYSVTVTYSSGCKMSASIEITKEPIQIIPITQQDNFCSANGKKLTAQYVGGPANYQWFLNNVLLPGTTQNIFVTVPGIYTVLVTPVNGCISKGILNVLPETLPVASVSHTNKLHYCPGEAINNTFLAVTAPGYCYQWYKNGTPVGTNSSSYSTTSVGSYWCVVSFCNTICKAESIHFTIYQDNCTSTSGGGGNGGNPGNCTPFTATVSAGTCNPVNFSSSLSNAAAASNITWNFGDGTSGNGLSTTHNYTQTGNYFVCADFAENSGFCYKSDECINVMISLAANFSAAVDCQKIYLRDLSSIVSGCTITTYNWTVAGPSGATATFNNNAIPSPEITVSQSGIYNVTLKVTSSCNPTCIVSITLPVTVSALPVVNFNLPSPVYALDTMKMWPSGLYNPYYQYHWDFGDGTSSDLDTVRHAYCNAGTYTVTLTLTDEKGCKASLSKNITVLPPNVTVNAPTSVCLLSEAAFSVSGAGGTFEWDFGDGAVSNLPSPKHSYSTAGVYTVKLKITGECSQPFTKTFTITVLQTTPVAIGPDRKVCPGSTALFTAIPSTFATYQWYKDGIAISGATQATYTTGIIGEYWVQVTNNNGCVSVSPHAKLGIHSLPVASIKADRTACTNDIPFQILNDTFNGNYDLKWKATGPATVLFNTDNTSPANVTISPKTPGDYQFTLSVEDKTTHCKSADTICITVVQSPTVTVTGPGGPLCEGQIYTFTATASPNISPDNYVYLWNNGATGNTMSTGKPGSYSVNAGNPYGCGAMAIAGTIKLRPDVSLFPVGCDTLCWTDTLRFPLPNPAPGVYTITWYDDDGTAITNVGNGYMLPLSKLQPGMHHLYATVSFAGGCADTTGIFDLYVKDCTLLPVCDNCTGLVESITVEKNNTLTGSGNFQLNSSSLTITILKPVKEVRISLADLKYYWKDTACNNCKVQMIERGCLFPATAGQNLGTLLLDNVSNVPPGVANNKCPDELVWKNGTALQPGTYTIPLQLSLPKPAKDKCVLVLDKLCFHVTVIDTTCKSCDKLVCAATNTDNNSCKCNAANVWTSLYLLPKKPGIPMPRSLILCNNTLTGYDVNTAYVLSGVFHCQGNCVSTKNEITIFNQVNQIIYTHVATALNETIVFPAFGMYSVTLSAWCGTKKCVCSFKIFVAPEPKEPPVIITTGGGTNPNGNPNGNPLPGSIDSVLAGIIPKDFNGQILVSRNDSTIYEKNISYKDSVNSHTAFDLASVTKTFTSMAILKLMDEGKLSLDDVVVKYLPEFPVPEITIKMLLSHRSGLEDYLKFMDESDWDKTKNLTNKDLLQFIAANKSKILINTPGKVFDYSNTNFALLSLIIEKISGRLYKDYLSATFFTPLQMNDTYILDAGNFARATKSYYKNGKTYALRYLDLVNGDKCVYSTVQDLKKWDKGLRSGKLFKKSTLDMAYAPTGPLSPFVSNYALGWKKIVTTNGLEMIYHTGWWAGCRSLLIRLPKDNTMIAILSNNNFTNIADIRKLCDLFGDYQQSNKKIANF